jgi:hypothetical protein
MARDHPFTIEIEFHIEKRMRRYRWGIYESGELRDRARESFMTKREAQADAAKAMDEHIATWRGKRTPAELKGLGWEGDQHQMRQGRPRRRT